MGVLHDYFRAPDAATAIAWAVASEAGLDDHGADWFDAEGAVEQFRALARRPRGQGHSVFVRTLI